MAKELNKLTYELKITDRHLEVIKSALDTLCWLRLGHIQRALWQIYISRDIDSEEFDRLANELKKLVFAELAENSWYGVGWREGDKSLNTAQIAYEIDAEIDYLKIKESGSESISCRSSHPLFYSNESPVELRKLESNEELQVEKQGDEFVDFDPSGKNFNAKLNRERQ